MKKFTTTLLISIAIFALLLASCTPAAQPSKEGLTKSLNVTGVGTVDLEPDLARINIGVQSQDPNAAEALKDNNQKIIAIIENMKSMGIEAEDIQTRNFNIYQRQEEEPREEFEDMDEMTEEELPKIFVFFVVENTVAVTVRDLDTLGEVLSSVVEEGANTIYGIVFDVEDREAVIAEARQLAIEDAIEKAQAIADDSDVSLGAIQSISVNEGGEYAMAREEMEPEMPQGGGAVPISSGTLNIRVIAELSYTFD
jgi:uncharacterized protein YggE